MFLAPVDIHGYILFNIIVTSKIGTNDSHLWSCVFRVIIFANLVSFTLCAICCNLDSQITPATEDLQAPIHWHGLPRGIEDKAIVNHRGFESYNTKQVNLPSPSMPQESCMIASLFSRTKKLNFSFFFYQWKCLKPCCMHSDQQYMYKHKEK